MENAPREQRRYGTIVAIEVILKTYSDHEVYHLIYERLSCGHLGHSHGRTWEETEAPLAQRPEQYQHYVGRRRRCHTCTDAATDARWAPDQATQDRVDAWWRQRRENR